MILILFNQNLKWTIWEFIEYDASKRDWANKNYEKLVEEFNNNYYYIERNANPKILFMDLILKTNELINTK